MVEVRREPSRSFHLACPSIIALILWVREEMWGFCQLWSISNVTGEITTRLAQSLTWPTVTWTSPKTLPICRPSQVHLFPVDHGALWLSGGYGQIRASTHNVASNGMSTSFEWDQNLILALTFPQVFPGGGEEASTLSSLSLFLPLQDGAKNTHLILVRIWHTSSVSSAAWNTV